MVASTSPWPPPLTVRREPPVTRSSDAVSARRFPDRTSSEHVKRSFPPRSRSAGSRAGRLTADDPAQAAKEMCASPCGAVPPEPAAVSRPTRDPHPRVTRARQARPSTGPRSSSAVGASTAYRDDFFALGQRPPRRLAPGPALLVAVCCAPCARPATRSRARLGALALEEARARRRRAAGRRGSGSSRSASRRSRAAACTRRPRPARSARGRARCSARCRRSSRR